MIKTKAKRVCYDLELDESIKDYKEQMHMIKLKAERVCYDLELDLNKLYRLSESRKGVELTQGSLVRLIIEKNP